MELISSTGLLSKGCFYDEHCIYRGKKYNYSEMTSVHACDGSILANEKIELTFFYGERNYCCIPFDRKHEENIIPIYERIKEFQKQLEEIERAKKREPERPESESFYFNVKGTSYRQKEIKKIVSSFDNLEFYVSEYYKASKKTIIEDYRYGEKIYKYDDLFISRIEFVFDPENEHDSNAIKVMLRHNSDTFIHVGFVPKDTNVRFGEILKSDGTLDVECAIIGGTYKIVSESGQITKGQDDYYISITAIFDEESTE